MLVWKFSNNPYICGYVENGRNNISMCGCSSIQGNNYNSCLNIMKPGYQMLLKYFEEAQLKKKKWRGEMLKYIFRIFSKLIVFETFNKALSPLVILTLEAMRWSHLDTGPNSGEFEFTLLELYRTVQLCFHWKEECRTIQIAGGKCTVKWRTDENSLTHCIWFYCNLIS